MAGWVHVFACQEETAQEEGARWCQASEEERGWGQTALKSNILFIYSPFTYSMSWFVLGDGGAWRWLPSCLCSSGRGGQFMQFWRALVYLLAVLLWANCKKKTFLCLSCLICGMGMLVCLKNTEDVSKVGAKWVRGGAEGTREEAGCISQCSTREAEPLGGGGYGHRCWVLPVTGLTLLIPRRRISRTATAALCVGCKMATASLLPYTSPKTLPGGSPRVEIYKKESFGKPTSA